MLAKNTMGHPQDQRRLEKKTERNVEMKVLRAGQREKDGGGKMEKVSELERCFVS